MQPLESPRQGKSRKDKRKRNLYSAKEQGQIAVSSQMLQTCRCDVVGNSKDVSGYCQGEQRLKVSFATTALISSVSCPVLDALIVFCLSSFVVLPQVLGQPISTHHLLLYCRKLSLAGLQISTKRSGCVPLLLCR